MSEIVENPHVALNNARADAYRAAARPLGLQALDHKGRTEAIRLLNAIPANGDNEASHKEADDILLKLLTDLNETDVVNAYISARERADFWYA
jgi:hypothetical protein